LITERGVPELIPVFGSQPAGDVSHKRSGRLPFLSTRPAVTLATLKRAATSFAALPVSNFVNHYKQQSAKLSHLVPVSSLPWAAGSISSLTNTCHCCMMSRTDRQTHSSQYSSHSPHASEFTGSRCRVVALTESYPPQHDMSPPSDYTLPQPRRPYTTSTIGCHLSAYLQLAVDSS